MLIKALGSSLIRALQLDKDAPVVFSVSGPDLLSSYVGDSARRVRALGAAARDAAKRFGLAIVLLDEMEYASLHRGQGDRSSPAYSNLTAALNAELQGLDSDAPVVWAATANRMDLVDSALLRPGRFSKKISVPRPNPETCRQILLVHLGDKPIAQGSTADDLSDQVVQRLFACDEENLLMRVHFQDGNHEEIFPPRIISGAILAEAVRGAALLAADRYVSSERQQPSGISTDDLIKAVYEQLSSSLSPVTRGNAHRHYLGLPEDQAVVEIENVWAQRNANEDLILQ
jgi:proteasome-associated ATPase